jgi:transposase
MIDPLPIPDELWAKVPPDAQEAIAAAFLAIRQRVDELETRLRDLEARLKLNSTNSSKPPSSDPIVLKRRPPAPPGGKKRGGQHHASDRPKRRTVALRASVSSDRRAQRNVRRPGCSCCSTTRSKCEGRPLVIPKVW